jgi:hypothetical protein
MATLPLCNGNLAVAQHQGYPCAAVNKFGCYKVTKLSSEKASIYPSKLFYCERFLRDLSRQDVIKKVSRLNDFPHFEVGGRDKSFEQIADLPNSYILADGIEHPIGKKLPLWLVGMLY